MPNAEMWWGQSSWRSDDEITTVWDRNWLTVRGKLQGAGKKPVIDTSFLGIPVKVGDELKTNEFHLNLLGQFWLKPDRMPETGQLYASEPPLGVNGHLSGVTKKDTLLDNPSADAVLTLEQTAYFDDEFVTQNKSKTRLIDANGEKLFPSAYESDYPGGFPRINFQLDREKTLHIELRLHLEIRLEGNATLKFWAPDRAVQGADPEVYGFKTPQWKIQAVGLR